MPFQNLIGLLRHSNFNFKKGFMIFSRTFNGLIYRKLIIYVFFLISCHPLFLNANIDLFLPLVISKLPHELPAFTQGLAIESDQLYESTGLYGQSSLRILDILTGKVLYKLFMPSTIFAEGIAAFPNQLVQITWKEQRALIYDRNTLKLQQTLFYEGEGWGLCPDGNTIWMSNGTSRLIQRDRLTFSLLKTLQVSLDGHPLENINDLECVGNHLYANIWKKNWIARIDKLTGEVTGIIDASSLLSDSEKARLSLEEVLNGIAYRAKTNTFFLTGKEWPWIFEVRLVPKSLMYQ